MTPRERIHTVLNHEEPDRVPIVDSPWNATVKRWRDEGLTAEQSPAEFFEYEMIRFQSDTSPRFPVKVIEEDEEYILMTTPFGGKRKNHRDYSTTPEVVDYPCKNRDDWERVKDRLKPDRDRVDWEGKWTKDTGEDGTQEASILDKHMLDWRRGLPGCRTAQEQGIFTLYSVMVGYDKIQKYVATEDLLIAVATEPEWVRDMYETDATLAIQMYEIMRDGGYVFDGAWLTSDLGYRNGLLFSPHHYEEQMRPTMRRLFDYFRGEGLPVFLHSCGCVNELVPFFVEDGLACLQPLEVKAGMDLPALKETYGDRLTLMGGIDVRTMANPDPRVVEHEISNKLSIAKQGGGYIYHSDHSVPNDVNFMQYKRVIELAKKYGGYSAG